MPVKKSKKVMSKTGIMYNQFFGMILIALGVGALIVIVRYLVVAVQVPTSVYLIDSQELIPGATN